MPRPRARSDSRPLHIAEVNDVASVASELARGLRARGHEVHLLQPRLIGGLLPGPVKPIVAPLRALDWADLVRRLRGGRFDLLHIHYAYLGMLGVLVRRPFILHCHGSDVWGVTPASGWATKRAFANAAHVFYATPDLAEGCLARRPDSEFLPNPIDCEMFRPTAPAGEADGVYIACALDDLKGAPAILDACRRMADSRPDIRVTGIAKGKYVREFAALPNVTLVPARPRAALPALIGRHGVVIGQVNIGAAGMAEFEAMACARPVICNWRFDAAYPEPPPFVRAASGEAIAAAVIRLMDDRDGRQQAGDASRAWVERHHGFERIVARVEEVALAAAERSL